MSGGSFEEKVDILREETDLDDDFDFEDEVPLVTFIQQLKEMQEM